MLVRLGEQPVGTLRLEEGEHWVFQTLPEYRSVHPRPVLGQVFEDDLERVWRSRVRLPRFFSNLLPEGPLRDLLAREVGVHPEREGFLLAHLGQDLPGAVVVEPEPGEELPSGTPKLDENGAVTDEPEDDETLLKFSLAGVQLKLSALADERGLTVPASGRGGDWILKLPLPHHPNLPQVELSMLTWAEAAGFEVPERRIVHMEDVRNLPADWPVRSGDALAVRRFDRPSPGVRVHQEDFAQVLNVYPTPESKYRSANSEVLGRVLLALTGESGLDEYVRRLVFTVLSGNGDAHLKNWSLVYPDGRTARLSPLYDQVYTRAFIEGDSLALNLGDEKDFFRIDLDTFRRFARKVRTDPKRVVRVVKEAAEQIREAWRTASPDLPLATATRQHLDRHLGEARL